MSKVVQCVNTYKMKKKKQRTYSKIQLKQSELMNHDLKNSVNHIYYTMKPMKIQIFHIRS